jgi:hypothetical protein
MMQWLRLRLLVDSFLTLNVSLLTALLDPFRQTILF